MNPYKILGLDEEASPEEIKNAYRRLSKENHPDTGGDAKVFMEIKKAYEILSDKEIRNTFDLYGVTIDFTKEAKELAFTVFFEVFNQLREGEPMDYSIRTFVDDKIRKHKKEMTDLEEKKIRLQRRILRIIERPEDDFITETATTVIDRYSADYKLAKLQHDLFKKALELLTDYRFDYMQVTGHNDPKTSIIQHFDLRAMLDERMGGWA